MLQSKTLNSYIIKLYIFYKILKYEITTSTIHRYITILPSHKQYPPHSHPSPTYLYKFEYIVCITYTQI